MNALYLIIEMFLDLLALLLSPAVQKNPDIVAVRTAQTAVFIAPLIFALKCVDAVFLLMQFLSRQGTHRIAVVEIIPRIDLLFHQIFVLRQI